MLHDLVKACRSYRRFDEAARIERSTLVSWIDAARLVASSGNAQPLRYALVTDERACEKVFSCCAWAKALPDWPGPEPGERPSAYIVILSDCDRTLADVFTAWDEGIAAQTIMLQAVEAGYGGCILGSFKRRSLTQALGIDGDRFKPDLVLALGKPAEKVVVSTISANGATEYWRDEASVHHVPKRPLSDVLL
ncbi:MULTISPECIES: nitroreductase family protein [unclassified Paraeggerthella]|uniref:nitroreductase family protein n=1 Tax=unclassified Paraeggerthella TaxID=2641972 RepID=UPI001CE3F072|nr:nitroreductase family protein [Paraeggerthella sp. Marseille-Q4926]MDY3981520.1 nitroreductase family protein [Paraeggerthella sp.]